MGSLYAPGTGQVESPVEKKEVGVTGQSIMSYVVYSINYKREKERENMVFVKVFSCLVFLKAVWNNQENLMKLKVLKSKI